LHKIATATDGWQGNLKVFPELKFTYEEDANSEEFFIPYIWTLVYDYQGLSWKAPRAAVPEAASGVD